MEPGKEQYRIASRRLLTRAALFWHAPQSRARKGAVESAAINAGALYSSNRRRSVIARKPSAQQSMDDVFLRMLQDNRIHPIGPA